MFFCSRVRLHEHEAFFNLRGDGGAENFYFCFDGIKGCDVDAEGKKNEHDRTPLSGGPKCFFVKSGEIDVLKQE